MAVWEELREHIVRGEVQDVLTRLAALDEAGRKEVARELPAFVRSDARDQWGWDDGQRLALQAAGATCLPGPAAAAAWLNRRDLRLWNSTRRAPELVLRVTGHRDDAWRAEVGRRIAARLRVADMDQWNGDGRVAWEVAARLLASAGAEPPTDDAFVVGWLTWRHYTPTAEDAFFPALVPAVFEAEGAGAALADERLTETGEGARPARGSWLWKLLTKIDREVLLDGCVRRFLRGGRSRDLAWFVRLHRALEPAAAESAARIRDYVRLLPVAPLSVAEPAFAQVKSVDAEVPLSGELFAEAAGALLFRPEHRLVKAALIWMDKTARDRGRESQAVALAATVFASEHSELRERAVKLAVRHSAKADPLAAEAVREAAGALPAALLGRIADAFGPVEAAEPQAPPVLYAPVPTDLPAPIASPAELLEEVVVHLRAQRSGWAEAERLLAGLVVLGPAVVDDLERFARSSLPYLLNADSAHLHGPALVVHALLRRRPRRALIDYRNQVLSRRGGDAAERPAPARLLHQRFIDAAAHLGTPALLATPTASTGHLDPEVFAARLRALEEAGEEPGLYDFEQALLRLPPGTLRVPGLDGLVSPAAADARDWLAAGGLASPELAYGFAEVTHRGPGMWGPGPRHMKAERLLAESVCESPLRSARLLATLTPPRPEDGHHYWQVTEWWPSLLPSHREVIAAHLISQAATWRLGSYDQGPALLALADATGPTGPATAAALIYGLASAKAAERAAAVDALLSFAAQDALPAADLGALLPRLLETGEFPFSRLLPSLAEAVQAGAALWPFFAEAVPALLPPAGAPARTGLGPFLALAATTAELHRVRAPLPALAAWTPSSPSSRPAKEAARLRQILASP